MFTISKTLVIDPYFTSVRAKGIVFFSIRKRQNRILGTNAHHLKSLIELDQSWLKEKNHGM
ncbi:hypothetical protein RW64_09150 [Geobacter sulfurreducens]|nr:hypothetical protein RW64_09150 [Geobacter sulfurreducens]